MQETPVRFPGQEGLLEKGQATHSRLLGLPWWLSWQRVCLQFGRPGFDPWVGKIPWRRERLPTPEFWPGEFHELCRPWGRKEADMTEWPSQCVSMSPPWSCCWPLRSCCFFSFPDLVCQFLLVFSKNKVSGWFSCFFYCSSVFYFISFFLVCIISFLMLTLGWFAFLFLFFFG